MQAESGGFLTRTGALVEAMTAAFLASHTLLGIGLIVFIGLQITVVLCGLYIRPTRNARQMGIFLLICLAALVFCCMTVWLLWKLSLV